MIIERRTLLMKMFFFMPGVLLIFMLGGVIWFTEFSWNALMNAAHSGSAGRVKTILERGVPVDARDPLGQSTALMVAAHNPGSVAACRVLLDNHADINAKNTFGNTALMLASSSGCTDVARFLISRKADVNITNNRGRAALFLARQQGHKDVALLLEQAGAK